MKKLVRVLGLTGLVSGYIMFTAAFLNAYITGGETIININKYGEANFELCLILFFLPFVATVILDNMRQKKNDN